jgi:hypothetical protein
MKNDKNKTDEVCTPRAPEEKTEEEILAYWTEERLKSAQPIPVPSPDRKAPDEGQEGAAGSEDDT